METGSTVRFFGKSRLPLVLGCFLAAVAIPPAFAQNSGDASEKIIVLINPNSNADATRSMVELARLETAGVAQVEGRSNESAPRLLTTPEDMKNAV